MVGDPETGFWWVGCIETRAKQCSHTVRAIEAEFSRCCYVFSNVADERIEQATPAFFRPAS